MSVKSGKSSSASHETDHTTQSEQLIASMNIHKSEPFHWGKKSKKKAQPREETKTKEPPADFISAAALITAAHFSGASCRCELIPYQRGTPPV